MSEFVSLVTELLEKVKLVQSFNMTSSPSIITYINARVAHRRIQIILQDIGKIELDTSTEQLNSYTKQFENLSIELNEEMDKLTKKAAEENVNNVQY